MRTQHWLFTILALALVSALAACGGGGGDGGGLAGEADRSLIDQPFVTFDPNEPGYDLDVAAANKVEESSYKVEYDKDAVVVDEETVEDDVLNVSDDGKTVRLRAGSATAEDLRLGDVVLFAGKAFGRVAGIDEDGDEVVVDLSGEANLAQVIKNGTFSWHDEINWSDLSVATLSDGFHRAGFVSLQASPTPAPTFATPTGLKFSGMFNGWQVSVELKPTPERLNMTLVAKYGDIIAVTGKGFISNFAEETFVQIENGKLGEAAVRATDLETEMELRWNAFRRNTGQQLTEVAQFTLPVAFKIPFLIGPIPFTFSVKAGLQVVPAFEAEASSGGSWKVNYKSSQGFKVDNTLGGPIGRMTGADIGLTDTTPAVTSSLGPAGFAVGVEFPRFELSVFGSTPIAFVTLKTYSAGLWTPGTTLSGDIPPCQMGYTEVSAQYGYAFSILGGKVGTSATADIWKQRKHVFKDNKPCSLDGSAAPKDSLTQGPGDSEIIPEPDAEPTEEPEETEEPTESPDETPDDTGDTEEPQET